ncbi:MAG: DUF4178 domain-containing protein [Myxococcaceae bacterium]|nr:DUF4178 domain-containing protein [Myxococcaceae bacterium]
MSQGQCPSCGAPVDFRPGAGQVKVCEHCRTVVLRGEVKLESMGKVALLVDTESPLKLGLFGKHRGVGFGIAGRIQKSHGKGTWDEWCLTFDDGRTGWLSESEGDWHLSFEVPGLKADALPQLEVAAFFMLAGQRFVVEERGHAKTVSAEGQLPGFAPEGDYVDATGANGLFATLDFGQGLECFVGSRVTLKELGFASSDLQPQPRKEALRQARCTECNGALDLKAPDATRRVACPYCGALLDVSHGALSFLQLLEKPSRTPAIPLGRQGFLGGTRYTVLAYLERSCVVDGNRFVWDEYLLYEPTAGFRWLMRSNHHWTFLTPIPAGDTAMTDTSLRYSGPPLKPVQAEHPVAARPLDLKFFQSVNATVDAVQGECYWEVAVGETAFAREYVAPPYSVNLDRTRDEGTFTFGELIDAKVVTEAFKLEQPLPAAYGIASASVNPWKARAREGFIWGGIWSVVLVVLAVVFASMEEHGTYLKKTFMTPTGVASGSPEAQAFSDAFEVPHKTPLDVEVTAEGLDNRWMGVQTDLVNDETGEVVSLDYELSKYSGTDEDGSWTEDNLSSSKSTSPVEPGRYVMRTTVSFDPALPPPARPYTVEVRAEGGGTGMCFAFFFILLLFALPIGMASKSSSFESTRWDDSVRQFPDWLNEKPKRGPKAPIELPEDDDDGGEA